MARNLWPKGVARMTDISEAINPSKFTIIPAGYRLTIRSWENDGDYWQTHSKDGLSLEECKFHIELCKLLYSRHGRHPNIGFGNALDPDDVPEISEAVYDVLTKHAGCLPADLKMTDTDDEDSPDWMNFAMEIISEYCGCSEDCYTRVFETFKVEYIPEEIKILDVSHQF